MKRIFCIFLLYVFVLGSSFSLYAQNTEVVKTKQELKQEKKLKKEQAKAEKKAEKDRKKAERKAAEEQRVAELKAAEERRIAEENAIEDAKQLKRAEKSEAKRSSSNNITDGKVKFGLSLIFTPQMTGYNEKIFLSGDAMGRGFGEISLDPLSFQLGMQVNVKKPFYDNGKVKWSAVGLYGIRYGREMYSFTHGEPVYGYSVGGQEGYMTAPEGTVDEAIVQSLNQSLLGGVRVDIGKYVYMHLVAGVTLILPLNLSYTDGITGKNYNVGPGDTETVPFDVYDKTGAKVDTLPYTLSLVGSSDLMFTSAFRFGVSAFFSEFEFSTSGNHSTLNFTFGLDLVPFFGSKNDY